MDVLIYISHIVISWLLYTGVQSHVESYQRLLKWYLIPPCLTLSIIRYVSRIKWSNPGKGVAPSSTPRCSSYWKGSLLVALDYGRQLYFFMVYRRQLQTLGNAFLSFSVLENLYSLLIFNNNNWYLHEDINLTWHPLTCEDIFGVMFNRWQLSIKQTWENLKSDERSLTGYGQPCTVWEI